MFRVSGANWPKNGCITLGPRASSEQGPCRRCDSPFAAASIDPPGNAGVTLMTAGNMAVLSGLPSVAPARTKALRPLLYLHTQSPHSNLKQIAPAARRSSSMPPHRATTERRPGRHDPNHPIRRGSSLRAKRCAGVSQHRASALQARRYKQASKRCEALTVIAKVIRS